MQTDFFEGRVGITTPYYEFLPEAERGEAYIEVQFDLKPWRTPRPQPSQAQGTILEDEVSTRGQCRPKHRDRPEGVTHRLYNWLARLARDHDDRPSGIGLEAQLGDLAVPHDVETV